MDVKKVHQSSIVCKFSFFMYLQKIETNVPSRMNVGGKNVRITLDVRICVVVMFLQLNVLKVM